MKIRNQLIVSLILMSISVPQLLLAQVAGTVAAPANAPTFWTKFPHYLEDPLVWLGFFMLLLICVSLFSLYETVEALYGKKKKYVEEVFIEPKIKKVSLWEKIMKGMTRSVPIAHEADVMLDHNYDGIRELDNQLPPWWKWGFYFTIAFAVVYLLSFHVAGTGKLSLAEYNDELEKARLDREERMKNSANFVTAENVTVLADAQEIAKGKSTFEKLCVACHGNAGQGNVGPNLTDDFWINGGGIKNVFHTITEGVPAKGMISWKSQLAPKQIQEVASFILTLHGTNPPGGKEPQGEKWIEEVKTDSVSAAKTDSTSKSPL